MSNETNAPDPNSMPMDDLINLVNSTDANIADEPEFEVEPKPVPETTEAEPEVEEEAKEEPKGDDQKEQDGEAEAASSDPVLPEHVKLRLEAAEAERKRFEALAGRHAGELGFLKNRLKDLEGRLGEIQSRDTDEVSDGQEGTETKPATRDAFAQWAIQQAIGQAVAAFSAQHPDADTMADAIQAHWKASGFDPASLGAAPDPITAAREATDAMELAYLHVSAKSKLEAADKAEKEAARRNVDESTRLANRRKAVAATPSGGVRAAVTPKSQDPRTMPMGELKQLIERLGAGSE